MSMTMEAAPSSGSAGIRLHGAWMWYKSAETNKWSTVFGVLKDTTLFFFISDETSVENHIGTLRLTADCRFHSARDGNVTDGYKFELHVDKKKKRKFRVKTVYERELWRAYMQGVITGQVPHDVILSPNDIQDIMQKLQRLQQQQQMPSSPAVPQSQLGQSQYPPYSEFHHHQQQLLPHISSSHSQSDIGDGTSHGTPSRHMSQHSMRPASTKSGGSGSGSSSGGEFDPPAAIGSNTRFSHFSHSFSSKDSGRSSDYSDGGPFMNHRFDPKEESKTPLWFFNECSREMAEKILTQCSGLGNTLMRVSTTARNTGSYAISKRLERSEDRKTGQVHHYEVIRVAEGYKINVDNPHKAMKTLTEVMQYFIELSGPSSTFPMTNNNLQQLGIDYIEYTRRISVQDHTQTTLSQGPLDVAEHDDNYEMPQNQAPRPPSQGPLRQIPQGAFRMIPVAPPVVPPGGQNAGFKTWGRDKAVSMESIPIQKSAFGGPQPKTIGPTDRRHNSSGKTTVQQQFQEQTALVALDDVLNKEEQRLFNRDPDRPPPLPAVPKNRPKLDDLGHPKGLSTEEEATDEEIAEATRRGRYQTRSQSVPELQVPPQLHLSTFVPVNTSSPAMIGPAPVKGAPQTAPKSNRPVLRAPSIPEDKVERPVSSPGQGILNELASKLQKRRQAAEQNETSDTSSGDNTSTNPSNQRQLPALSASTNLSNQIQLPKASTPDTDGELYEPLGNNLYQNCSQEYQNCSPK